MEQQEKFIPEIRFFKEFVDNNVERVESGSNKCNVYDVMNGHWYVSDQMVDQFLKHYDECIQKGAVLHTYEKSSDIRGMMIDIDIIQTKNYTLYSNDLFASIALMLYETIIEMLDGGSAWRDRCFVTRKPEITKLDKYDANGNMLFKDGVHILFPSIRISKAFRKHILQVIQNDFKNIFDDALTGLDLNDTEREILHTSSDVTKWIDTHAAVVQVMLPGSCKADATKKPHDLVYSANMTYATRRNKSGATALQDNFADLSGSMALVLKHSKYTYNHYTPREGLIKEPTPAPDMKSMPTDDDEEYANIDVISIQNAEAAYITKLLDILPSQYYDDYALWFKVLCALSSISERFKCIGYWFSKKSSKFDKEVFDKTWSNLMIGHNRQRITKRSIMYWARKENPVQFAKINAFSYYKMLVDYILESSGDFSHGQHAKILFSILSHKYVYSTKVDAKNARLAARGWYVFVMPEDQHIYGEVYKWRSDPTASSLKKYIIENYKSVLKDGEKYINEQIDKINPTENSEISKQWTVIKKNYKMTMKNVGSIPYIDNIIRAAELYFERREFIEELDKDEQLIGVANGVLQVGKKCVLIEEHHEHAIMLHTKAAYMPYDETSAAVMRVRKIFSQVYREPDVCDFVWYVACTGLDRRPVTGKMVFIIGAGANGKTVTMNFIQNALGLSFCASIKMALLTGQTGKANEADSAFMQAKGKTLLIFDEGSGSDVLNSEKVKNLVNSGAQSSRDLFGSQENFWLHCCSFNTTNHPPTIRSTDTDHGFWRRVLFVHAKSKFTENPDPNRENEFSIDSEIENTMIKDPLYLNATLSIMSWYYEQFITKYGGNLNNVPCDTIKNETKEFRREQDKSFRYCYERIIISPLCTLGASDLGEDYSNWAAKQFKDSINASKAENYLSTSAIGDFKSGFDYLGIRMKSHNPVNKSKHELTFAEYHAMSESDRRKYNDMSSRMRIEANEAKKTNDELVDEDE